MKSILGIFRKKPILILVAVLFAVIFIWLFFWPIFFWLFSFNLEKSGQFGDMFGALNALFSGLAFAVLIYTIYLQSEELKLQREEIEKNSAALKDQKQIVIIQNFETTFFNMLNSLNLIINSVNGPIKGFRSDYRFVGRVYFNSLFKHIRGPLYEWELDPIIDRFDKFYPDYQHNLNHYFRNIHIIMNHINQFSVEKIIKLKYSSILQAQLSDDELGLIMLYSLCDFSKNSDNEPEFKNLLDDLNILENISENFVADKSILSYFPNTKFKFTREKSTPEHIT